MLLVRRGEHLAQLYGRELLWVLRSARLAAARLAVLGRARAAKLLAQELPRARAYIWKGADACTQYMRSCSHRSSLARVPG